MLLAYFHWLVGKPLLRASLPKLVWLLLLCWPFRRACWRFLESRPQSTRQRTSCRRIRCFKQKRCKTMAPQAQEDLDANSVELMSTLEMEQLEVRINFKLGLINFQIQILPSLLLISSTLTMMQRSGPRTSRSSTSRSLQKSQRLH